MRRLTDSEVLARYGDPTKFLSSHGDADAMWKVAILGSFTLPAVLRLSWNRNQVARSVSCHKDVMFELRDIFNHIYANKEAWASIGDYGGCYMWRPNRNNPKVLSRHSWGLAVDMDVADNPNGGAAHMHPHIIKCFAERGWLWGGDHKFFPTIDAMHFEKGVL